MNIQDLKSQIDLRAYLESQGYKPYEVHDEYSIFLCPFHSEKTPSLTVWNDRYKCFGCGEFGDVLNFVCKTQRVTVGEAIRILEENISLAPTLPASTPIEKPKIDLAAIALRHRKFLPAVSGYLEERAVDLAVAQAHWGGGVIDYPHTYRFQNGSEVQFVCQRVSLPNVFGDQVRGINYRRDDDCMLLKLSEMSSELLLAIRRDMESRGHWSQPAMLDAMFGPKYLRHRGSQVKLYNADMLAFFEGGELRTRVWSYMLVNEGKEIDVLSLLSAGYPAVGIPQNNKLNFKALFDKIPVIYILADNDNPGIAKAKWIRDKLGRGEIIVPPDAFKDANDVARAGKLERWLGRYGIKPILNQNGL